MEKISFQTGLIGAQSNAVWCPLPADQCTCPAFLFLRWERCDKWGGKKTLHYGVYHKMGIKNLDKVLNSWTSRNVRQNIGGIDWKYKTKQLTATEYWYTKKRTSTANLFLIILRDVVDTVLQTVVDVSYIAISLMETERTFYAQDQLQVHTTIK